MTDTLFTYSSCFLVVLCKCRPERTFIIERKYRPNFVTSDGVENVKIQTLDLLQINLRASCQQYTVEFI